jgi:hypothetical protein
MARPKGIATWNPDDETLALLNDVRAILDEYRAHLPLTARQIFYRLVGKYGYAKDEKAYARLCEKLVRARRALMIPFGSIRDDGTVVRENGGFDDVTDFWKWAREHGEYYRRNRQAGQPVFIELSCEAGGMVPQMVRVCAPYSVPVYSGGGFNSLTAIKEVADRALERDVPTVLLHVGDFDPSGVSIFNSLGVDAALFVSQVADVVSNPDRYEEGFADRLLERVCPDLEVKPDAELRPVRVALTLDQVEGSETEGEALDTAPPKKSDTRSVNWPHAFTAQAEALPPDVLARIVQEAIRDHLDMGIYQAERERESEDRKVILKRIDESAAA